MQDKCIVFDLDHTIGYFKQFIQILNHTYIDKVNDSYLFLFETFPEYFRPNIFYLFEYLILKRRERKISSIILYTNNNNDMFVNKVIEFINYKIKDKLFDHIITVSHPLRKNKYKDYNDLIECSGIHSETNICFIDDKKHESMRNKKVVYIQCEPYIYNIKSSEIFNRSNIKVGEEKNIYILNMNNQKRVTEQIMKRIQWFINTNRVS